jgi:hypothetical protein
VADAVLDRAVDLAREVAVELADDPSEVGEYLGAVTEGERLVSHRFASAARGYHGWQWTVTVARVPRGRSATVCEAALLPGPDAILAQAWLPWAERLRPGDIGPGDVLPFRPDDPRLVPGYVPTGDADEDGVAIGELALARMRVLSPVGIDEAAQRWYRGSRGPTSAGALASEQACSTCGFLVPLAGSLGQVFGVCANEWSPDDGKVVSYDHGCGAHSETDVTTTTDWPAPEPVIDETAIEVVAVAPAPEPSEPEAPVVVEVVEIGDVAPDDAPPSPRTRRFDANSSVRTDDLATSRRVGGAPADADAGAEGIAEPEPIADSEPEPIADPDTEPIAEPEPITDADAPPPDEP